MPSPPLTADTRALMLAQRALQLAQEAYDAAVAAAPSAAWGSITGTLASQTDLTAALTGKLNASLVSAYGLTLIDDLNQGAARTTLGLVTVASTGSAADLTTGTLPAGRMPALTGDVTSSAGGVATTIAAGVVSLSKLANMATGSLYYRKTAGTGAPEVQTLATLKTDLGLTGTNSGDQTITLTGDVTGSGTGSFAATIASGAVTLAKQANVATGTVFYRKTAGTGAPEVQTLATLKTDLGLAGTNSGDQTSVTGNAGTATKLATARTISGVSFDGSANITINDTDLGGAAWTSYTPVVNAWPGGGSIVSYTATGKYKKVGKTVFVNIEVNITDAGTSSSFDEVTLPLPLLGASAFYGQEGNLTGKALSASHSGSTKIIWRYYDGSFAGGTNVIIRLSGTYETT